MKIGMVCPYNMARGGAVIEIVKDMRAGLMRRGHTVKIITGRPKDVSAIGVDPNDLIFVGRVNDINTPIHTQASLTMADSQELKAMLEAERFDILHFQEPAAPFLGKQLLDVAGDSIPRIATFHAKLPDTPLSQAIGRAGVPYMRALFKDLDELIIGSPVAADYLRTFTDRHINYIPLGVDLEAYKSVKRKKPGAHKKILFVGRLEHRKGVKYLIQAFTQLAQSRNDVELVLAGKGPDMAKLQALVNDLGMQDRITFLGFVDNATKIRLMGKADLFCSPAIFGESFSLVTLEAMGTGLVSVVGNNPGYAALMQGLGALSLVDPYDTKDFASRLGLLLDEEPLRDLWRKWALQHVKKFDYRGVIKQHEALYERAIAGKRSMTVERISARALV